MNEQVHYGRLIGAHIKTRREGMHLSQGQLSAYARVSKSYLSRMERGLVPRPSAGKLQDIARVLNCSLADLVGPDSDVTTTPLDVPVDKAPVVRRLLRYSVDQLTRLADGAGAFFSAPVEENEHEQRAENHAQRNGQGDEGEHQSAQHPTMPRRIRESRDRRHHVPPGQEHSFC